MPRPEKDIGFPEFAQVVHDRYPELFPSASILEGLVQNLMHLMRHPVQGSLETVLYHLAAIVANSFGAVRVLVSNGYGYDAMRLARGMYEAAVNAEYLRRHPDLVDDFVDHFWVKRKKLLDYFQQNQPAKLAKIPAAKIPAAKIETEYQRVKSRFSDGNGRPLKSWCRVSLRDRANAVGLGDFYPTFYASASGVHHADISGLTTQSDPTTFTPDIAPSLRNIKDALVMAHHTVLLTVESLNKAANLGMEKDIQEAVDALARAFTKSLSADDSTENRTQPAGTDTN